jgi:hypothetical protein
LWLKASNMQKFEYRTPRYQVDLPVILTVGRATVPGRCSEISKEGMRVELREPVALDSRGSISLSYKDLSLELPVCVTRSGQGHDGLKFIFASERDRGLVDHLIALLAAATGQPGPVLVR